MRALLVALPLFALAAAGPSLKPPRSAAGVSGLTSDELFPSTMHPRTRAAHSRMMAKWITVGAPAAGRTVIDPTAFGADPTCTKDSAPAFTAITAAFPNYVVGNMSDGIRDLGGAVVDLAGGCYLVSQPFIIPQFYGNIHVQNGELRATTDFPSSGSVITVGSSPCNTPSGQGSCNENVGFHSVTIDGSHVAAACLTVTAAMGATIDSSSAIFGFVSAGIAIEGGHEFMAFQTWVAAYFWSSPLKEKTNSTGIAIDGNDHFVTDCIVFSARIGIRLTGAANLVSAHTWNCATGNGGIGILNEASQNRFQSCYLDYTNLVLQGSSGAQGITVADGFFLGGACVLFKAMTPKDVVYSVSITNNVFAYGGGSPFQIDESTGMWTAVTGLSVFGTSPVTAQPYVGPSSTLVQTTPTSAGVWTFNYSTKLLFPSVPIAPESVAVQVLAASAPAATVYAPVAVVDGQTVTVYAQGTTADYSVRVYVSQSASNGA